MSKFEVLPGGQDDGEGWDEAEVVRRWSMHVDAVGVLANRLLVAEKTGLNKEACKEIEESMTKHSAHACAYAELLNKFQEYRDELEYYRPEPLVN